MLKPLKFHNFYLSSETWPSIHRTCPNLSYQMTSFPSLSVKMASLFTNDYLKKRALDC